MKLERRKDTTGFSQLCVKIPEAIAIKFRVQAVTEHVPLYTLFERVFDSYLREQEAKASAMDTSVSTKSKKHNTAREDA